MSTALHSLNRPTYIELAAPTFDLNRTAPQSSSVFDATTTVTLRFLLAPPGSDEQLNAFKELVAICRKVANGWGGSSWAKRSLFLTGMPYIVVGYEGEFLRREGDPKSATKSWIEEWLLQELRPYRELSWGLVLAAAQHGAFCDLALRCRNALAREVQRHKRQAKDRLQEIPLDPLANEEGGQPGPLNFLGTQRPDAPSSLAQEPSLEERMKVGERILNIAIDHSDDFNKLDLLHGLLACGRALETHGAPPFTQRDFDQQVTNNICVIRGVKPTRAQQYKRKFVERIREELASDNPLVEAVRLELVEPVSPRPFLIDPPPTAKANKQLMHEAGEDNREFYKFCSQAPAIFYQEPELPRFVD